jgi:DNA repair protein RecO
MTYHKYVTPGIIVASYPRGESDRTFTFYTRELGLVHARATSIREERSRLRYTFQSFSVVHLELIRGRSGWRVASGKLEKHFSSIRLSDEKRFVATQYLALMSRLIKGTEPHHEVFDRTYELLEGLEGVSDPQAIHGFELVASVTMLSLLGYWRDDSAPIVLRADISPLEHFKNFEGLRSHIVPAINNALRLSQL